MLYERQYFYHVNSKFVMLERMLTRLIEDVPKLVGLITLERLKRLLYYLRIGQYSIIFARARSLLTEATYKQIRIPLVFPSDTIAPIIFSRPEKPLVSIVIPVYNQWSTTWECLVSILRNTEGISYEVIVADDSSQDETVHIATLAPGVRHITNEINIGFLRNCNRAARDAKGKYLLLLNNDTIVQPDWLAPLIQAMEQNDEVGMVGPMLLYPNGRVQEAGGIIWRDGSGWNYGRHDVPDRPEYNYIKETDYISGACLLLKRTLWDEIGGFDERFAPAYYEDTDLAFEVRRRGYRVLYQPLSRVVHLEGVSHGTDTSRGIKTCQAINQLVFRRKWQEILNNEHGRDSRDLARARDRSIQRKRVLFIDHYVPRRDQDAGSRSTFQYLSLFTRMGYQVTFMGDNFVDYQPYTRELQQMGIEVLYGANLQRRRKQWVMTHADNFDYVYLSRPHIAHKYLSLIRSNSSAKLLYCGHDLHFIRAERHYELEPKRTNLREAKKWVRMEENILRSVDIGYFFSSHEVSEVRRRFQDVAVRVIPLYLFDGTEQSTIASTTFPERSGLLFVGGFMHQPNVDGILWFLAEVFSLVREWIPDITITIVGSNPPADIARFAGEFVRVTGRVSDKELEDYYTKARLVVAPLRYGAGVKGKIVEAMRHGVPTVTTSVGAEGIGDADKALQIADDAEYFASQVLRMYLSQVEWEAASQASLRAVKVHFSEETARAILLQDMPPFSAQEAEN